RPLTAAERQATADRGAGVSPRPLRGDNTPAARNAGTFLPRRPADGPVGLPPSRPSGPAGTSACPSASIEPPPAAFAPPCMMPELVAVGSSTRARTRVCDDSSRWGRAQHGDRPRAHNRRDEGASPEGSSGLQNLVAE